jgi:hypothetical protein
VSPSPGRGNEPERAGENGRHLLRDTRDRITSCPDLDTLTLWFDRSLTATAVEDLFAEE